MMRYWFAAIALLVGATSVSAQPAPACRSSLPYGENAAAGRYANANGIKIYYEVYGDGPALLMLHGNGGSIASRVCQIDHFKSARKVIAVDSRGHGKSEDGQGPLTFEQQADDFIAVLDVEKIDKADVLGQSDGGILALELGIRHPNRIGKIVASGPNLRPDATALYDWFIENMKTGIQQAEAMIAAGDTTRNWKRRKRQIELDFYEPHISLEALHSITAPVLLVGADEDVIRPEHYIEMYRALGLTYWGGILSGPPESIDRLRVRVGSETGKNSPYAYINRRGVLRLPFDEALDMARRLCAAEPATVLIGIETTERKWAREAATPGEEHMTALLTEYRASWALIRQWAGHDAAVAQREAEIQRLERLVWDAIYALQKAGLEREASRLRRAVANE